MRSNFNPGAVDRGKAVATLNELGHLASGVGHHVINAFSAIVSNAEIMRMKLAMPDPPDPAVLAEAIIRTALEASAVARRLIDVTRPLTESGHEAVSLDKLITDFAAECADCAECPDVASGRVQWTVTPGLTPPILGNSSYLRSMLHHLTANSIEAAVDGEIKIHISTSNDSRGWVVLEIRDTGVGMTPEVMQRAVEPFFSTKTDHLGVGLSIGNGIWRRHKGTLSIRSVPGRGTTIRLCIEPIKNPPRRSE